MLKRRFRRREVPVDVHSEDEEEFDIAIESSDLSESEASEDSDVESEASHSEGEEGTQEEVGTIKEDLVTREELGSTKENAKSIHEKTNSHVENTISSSSEDLSKTGIKSKVAKKTISINKQKLKADEQEENNYFTVIKDSDTSSSDEEVLQSHSDENEKLDNSQNSVNTPEIPLTGWQKKVLARQEYRKKLADDPAFVPHLGEFWGHDDRFIKDELKNDFDSHHRKPPIASRGRGVWGNPPPRGRWDHDGFQELMKIEDEEKHRKGFQRSIQHRREFFPPPPRRRSHNIASPKSNYSRPSNFSNGRRGSSEEKSRSRGKFFSRYDAKNKEGSVDDFNQYHKPNVGESRSENSYNDNGENISSSQLNDNKTSTEKDSMFQPRGRNGFRGRGYSSRHYMRSNLNRNSSFTSSHADNEVVNRKKNVDKDKSEEQLNDDVINTKDSDVVHNGSHENLLEKNKDKVVENQVEEVRSAKDLADVNAAASSSSTKEGIETKSSTKEQDKVYEGSNEGSEVEIILDPQSKKAIENNGTHSTSQSINNITSSLNDLSISNNKQNDTTGSLSTDKDRVQTNQASKRYSTKRAASSSTTQQQTQTNESSVKGVSNNSRTSEIPPSAVFAPPFQPRALALSNDNPISNEDTSNNFLLQKPPISYYTDNQGLRNNLSTENNLPHPTPAPYENNGVYYYYPPVYYPQ
ncbi:5322_t:CDS:2 [Funneliformis caledonium]|uniref:5322_t:CDS:1 n=1 Tax=Funneliformis caledonium TaxID=1117310 RepID=A0A9N9CK71_9GLOM|nr:5322_t:CDS:2 [Funneliformis caledonium]